MGISGISGLGTQLAGYLTQLQEKQGEEVPANEAASNTEATSALLSTVQTDSVNISSLGYTKSQDMIGINSAGSNTTEPSYTDAYMTAASAQLSLQNSMNSSLQHDMKSTMDSVNEAAFWSSPGMHTALMMKTLGASFQDLFKALQDNVDQQIAKAQEAHAQEVKDGNAASTAQDTTAPSTDSASTDTTQTQDATPQTAAATPAESASTDTSQVSDANVGSDAGAQAAAVVSPTTAASGDSGGGAQATATPSSISITV